MNKRYTRAPHRSRIPSEEFPSNAALLIDFDNVTMAIRSNLAQELDNLLNSDVIGGKVAVQRAYADWRRYPQYIVPLSESSIDLIFAPAYGSTKKNATDIRLAIDALELVFIRPEIGTFILLSGDSDFSSLVLKLKEYGKYVIGVGLQESSSDILVQNCDEYYSYTGLSGLREASEMQVERLDPWELVERAIRRMTERNDVMRSDRLKQVMLELDSGFDEKSIGYSKFNRFLAEAAARDKVRLRKAANGQYEVSPVDVVGSGNGESSDRPRVSRGRQARAEASTQASVSERRIERGRRNRGRRRGRPAEGPEPAGDGVSADALRAAYGLLAASVRELSSGDEGVRDSEVKRKMLAKDAAFDETALGFRKFSRFLQQAHDEGVVDLKQGEDGNYYIRPPGEPSPKRSRGRGRRRPSEAEERQEESAEAVEVVADGASDAGKRGSERTAQPSERTARAAERTGQPSERTARGARRPARAKRGLGRFRRGSRAGPKPAGASGPIGAGPVEVQGSDTADERSRAEEEPRAAETTTEPLLGGAASVDADTTAASRAGGSVRSLPGGLGRFRRGSRGGGDALAGSRTEGETPSPGSAGAGAVPARKAIDHMVRNYPGVGERTASRLVKEFGDAVFEVIDTDPDRVTQLLSERRARAVLEARRVERESGEADAPA